MLPLLIAIIGTTGFSLIIRYSQRQSHDQFAVMAINYLVAAVLGFACAGGQYHMSPPTIHIGLIGGIVFVTTYIFLIHSMDLKGVAIANAITRLSVLIPVLVTIIAWGERPRAIEGFGALLALLAMPLLSLDRTTEGGKLTRRQVPLLLALFATNGSGLLTSAWFHSTGLEAERSIYFGLLFTTAAAVSVLIWLIWSRRCGWREFVSAIPLGILNYLTGIMVIRALDTLPGTLVFPLFAAMGLALTTGIAAWAWQEKPGRLGQIGIAVALLAVVLIKL